MSVAFPGDRGAFAELAAIEYFGRSTKITPLPEFGDVFKAVQQGKFRYGVVPIENSLAGSIHQNYDLLLDSNLFIAGEVLLKIRHFLLANRGTSRRNIKKVYSHPAVFPQCRNFFRKFPDLEKVAVSNTATAVKMLQENGMNDAAAIGSLQAALDFRMKVLARNIEDTAENTTRFIVIAKKVQSPPANARKVKSSIVFSTRNIPGALYKCLSVFALRDIDLYKIESRPIHSGKGFQYLFYLDFEGNARNEVQRNAINHLQEITTFYRFLGSYPTYAAKSPVYRERVTKAVNS